LSWHNDYLSIGNDNNIEHNVIQDNGN
jgi:hypothetical protein